VDLDLGRALAGNDPSADTGESPTLDPDRFDLLLEPEHPDYSGATTREMAARADAPTVEQPALHSSAFEESPTVEMPAYGVEHDDDALLDKLDLALKQSSARAPEATAEISVDDLGFDIDSLGDTSTAMDNFGATDSSTLHPSEAATLVAGLDAQSRSLLAGADADRTREMAYAPHADLEPTRETPQPPAAGVEDATMLAPRANDSAATELLPAFDAAAAGETSEIELSSSDLDLDLDELARALENDTVAQPRRDELRFSTDVFATGIHKVPGNGMDLDVGAPLTEHRDPTVTERMPHDLDLPELEPVTLSEVGTKLDLARAYMDMGDPDGARSILQEVLNEGSSSQKVEAQRLIETLPR
jgi:pilus assembly protein FimV